MKLGILSLALMAMTTTAIRADDSSSPYGPPASYGPPPTIHPAQYPPADGPRRGDSG